MLDINKVYLGDCLDVMKNIESKSVDMVLCDLPFQQTKNKWDTIIPFESLWKHYDRITKENSAIILFANGMFTSDLMQSNKKMWKYNLIWDKILPSGFLNANRQFLREHEDICVFYKKQPTYNPQMIKGTPNHSKGKPKQNANNNYGDFEFVDNKDVHKDMKFPKSILTFQKTHPSKMLHPTEKPLELLEYLIKTFTNEGDVVLDNTMGSGSTIIASLNTNRNFIGIEKDEQYFNISLNRIKNLTINKDTNKIKELF